VKQFTRIVAFDALSSTSRKTDLPLIPNQIWKGEGAYRGLQTKNALVLHPVPVTLTALIIPTLLYELGMITGRLYSTLDPVSGCCSIFDGWLTFFLSTSIHQRARLFQLGALTGLPFCSTQIIDNVFISPGSHLPKAIEGRYHWGSLHHDMLPCISHMSLRFSRESRTVATFS